MSNCNELHTILRKGKKFYWNTKKTEMPENGIYILFDRDEKGHDGDRIVRIGTHKVDKRFRERITEHFNRNNKDGSVFRKNIGLAMLKLENDDYLDTWALNTSNSDVRKKYKELLDKNKEKKKVIENKVSEYLRTNFYFVVLTVETEKQRLELEAKLIGTVSNCHDCRPSLNWLGNNSPKIEIRESGLWLTACLYSPGLTKEELILIDSLLKK